MELADGGFGRLCGTWHGIATQHQCLQFSPSPLHLALHLSPPPPTLVTSSHFSPSPTLSPSPTFFTFPFSPGLNVPPIVVHQSSAPYHRTVHQVSPNQKTSSFYFPDKSKIHSCTLLVKPAINPPTFRYK